MRCVVDSSMKNERKWNREARFDEKRKRKKNEKERKAKGDDRKDKREKESTGSRYDDESMSDYWQRVFAYKIPIRVFSSLIYVRSKLRNADATTSWKSCKPRAKLILQQPYP